MTATTAPTTGPAFTLTYTLINGAGTAEVRIHPIRDEAHGADQLAAAIRLQKRQGGRFADARLAPASRFTSLFVEARGNEKLFAALMPNRAA